MEKGFEKLLDKLKHVKKDYLLIGILTGVLLLVIAVPTTEQKKSASMENLSQSESGAEGNTNGGVEALEQRLVRTLEKVQGVGKVEVMLTQISSGEKIVEKDNPVTDKNTQEEDSEGGVRTAKENTSGEETVYEKDENGNQTPYVVKELEPEIGGVLIVAQGGGDPVIVNNITDAVMSLFHIEAHKIKVMKMN